MNCAWLLSGLVLANSAKFYSIQGENPYMWLLASLPHDKAQLVSVFDPVLVRRKDLVVVGIANQRPARNLGYGQESRNS